MAKRALRRAPRSAFTLIEIVLVLTIIAVLVAAGIKLLTGNVEFAQETRVESDIQNFASQLQLYEARNFSVPSTEQGLQALVTKPTSEPVPAKWTQLLEEVPRDPWGTPYGYKSPGERSGKKYDLYSFGPDKQDGTEDDIGNWKNEK